MRTVKNDLYPILQRVKEVRLGDGLDPIADEIVAVFEQRAGYVLPAGYSVVSASCDMGWCYAGVVNGPYGIYEGNGKDVISAIRDAVGKVKGAKA